MRWWEDAVVYEVYVRSFADSDGDGIGDLEGIRTRLPYLADLGVDAVWITPFYPSPQADHGYDVADYCGVDPRFGSLESFDRLVADAHALGLRVVVDVVPNHTSSEHPWFRAAVAGDPEMRRRYTFRGGDQPPNNWQSVFSGPAWTQLPTGDWYLHLFDSGQPDVDWHEPAVHDEWERILRFWLDRGVDGFRIDVAHSLYTPADLSDEPEYDGADVVDRPHIWDQPEVVDVYRRWRSITDGYDGDRMMVGEVYLVGEGRVARYLGEDRLHTAFDFRVPRVPWDASVLRQVVELNLEQSAVPTWVLSNHDHERHVTRFGGGDLGRRRALAMTAFVLALPGSPYLYQGEELGLEQVDVPPEEREDPVWLRSGGTEPGRDGCRTPMPWSASAPGLGFTTGTPWLPFGPRDGALAVDQQLGDPGSVLSSYRRLLALRRSLRGRLGRGVEWLETAPDVVAFRREGGLVCVLSTAAEAVELQLPGASEVLASTAAGAELADGLLTVPPAATVWLR